MSVAVQHVPSALLVVIRGVVDAAAAPELEARLARAIEDSVVRPVRVLVDLSPVEYLDVAGLDCLLRAHDEVLAGSGSFRLVDPHRASVIQLLHLAHLDGMSWMTSVDVVSSLDAT